MSDERGSVSIVTAAVAVLALVLSMGLADVGKVLIVRSRARGAADAAALAAVQELAIPTGADPVALAADYASRNGATLISCSCDAGTAEAIVEVEVSVGGLLLATGSRVVDARARAVVDLPS